MCGIAGWVARELDLRTTEAVAQRMCQALAHRGSDGSGIYLSKSAAFVHRRFAPNAPEDGAQPMTRRLGDHTYVIACDGTLYNGSELRHDLEAHGWHFHTHSDAELFLISYIQWGSDAPPRLGGSFAFAVWNEAEQTLFLARDRLGAKPLFYANLGGAIIFGSEPKALMAHPLLKPIVDAEGMGELFLLGPARTPGHGIFKDLREVKPGHSITVSPRGVFHRQYWKLSSLRHTEDLAATARRVRELLSAAVASRLVEKAPVGMVLSAGIESTGLAAIAARSLAEGGNGPLHTYSIHGPRLSGCGQPGTLLPDRNDHHVEGISQHLGTRHQKVTIEAGHLTRMLHRVVGVQDFPGVADLDAAFYLLCKAIAQKGPVTLSGACAGELFGSSPWFHRDGMPGSASFPWSRQAQLRADLLAPWLRPVIRPQEYVAERYIASLKDVPHLLGEPGPARRLRERMYLALTWFTPMTLSRIDRMSTATGLDVRLPFCDHRLVEYLWNVPWEMKGRKNELLRVALGGMLPDGCERTGRSASNPDETYTEIVRRWLLDTVSDPTSAIADYVDLRAIRRLAVRGSRQAERSGCGEMMSVTQLFAYLVQLDLWMRANRVEVRV